MQLYENICKILKVPINFPKIPNGIPWKLSWWEVFTVPQWHDTLMKLFSVGGGTYEPYPTIFHLHSGEACPYSHQNVVGERPPWESGHARVVFLTWRDFTLAPWIHDGQRQRHVHSRACPVTHPLAMATSARLWRPWPPSFPTIASHLLIPCWTYTRRSRTAQVPLLPHGHSQMLTYYSLAATNIS